MIITPTMADDDNRPDQGDGDGVDTVIVAKPKSKTQRPSMYKVLLLNDDYRNSSFWCWNASSASQTSRRLN